MKGGSINRDERQTVLDHFFRLACLQAMAEDGDKASDLDPARVDEVVHVRLTRTEFAEALGMQPSSIFVRNIFLLADSDGDGFVSFHEFLRLFAVFLKGL
ncbi:hypothetical protein V1264_002219 [Littorina saxatilis]|uniref:EF-hand domain-containing protein n=1 Tax=Littorina saxatilis TaxID=31220 RepID=A0AAN9C2Z9_9CAEN